MSRDETSNNHENGHRNPGGTWRALLNIVNRYATYWRAQAEKAKEQQPLPEGFYAKLTAISTAFAAILAFVAAIAFWRQFYAMESEQRPWVYADQVTPGGRIVLAKGQYAVPLKFSIKNTGHRPAFFVIAKTRAAILSTGESSFKIRNDVCDEYKSQPLSSVGGDSVFAEQTITHEGFSSDDYPAVSKDDWDITPGEKMIIVYGCVDYQYPEDTGHHQSRFAFAVGKAVDQGILKRIGPLPDDPTSVDVRLNRINIADYTPPS